MKNIEIVFTNKSSNKKRQSLFAKYYNYQLPIINSQFTINLCPI